MRYLVILIAIMLNLGPAFAEERVWTMLETSETEHALTYSGCPPEECFGEAITHSIGCSVNGNDAFFDMASGPDNLKIVNAIAAREAMPPAVMLMVGGQRAGATVHNMTLYHNDMDGGWGVRFLGYDFADLFKAIAGGDPAQLITITVEGETFVMNPSQQDGEKLKALAVLCEPKE